MQIESITKYKGTTFCLILSSGQRLYIGEDVLYQYDLKTGVDYDEKLFEDIKAKHILGKAKRHAMYALGRRAYCYGELCAKLEQLYGEEVAVEVCDYIEDMGYINDDDYARDFAENAILNKRWGVSKTRFEMSRRGLDKTLIEDVLSEYDKEIIREQITKILETRFYGRLDEPKEINRAINYFLRRGYQFADIKHCIQAQKVALDEETDDDYDWE